MKDVVLILCGLGSLVSVFMVLASLAAPEWGMKILGILAGIGLFQICKLGMEWAKPSKHKG